MRSSIACCGFGRRRVFGMRAEIAEGSTGVNYLQGGLCPPSPRGKAAWSLIPQLARARPRADARSQLVRTVLERRHVGADRRREAVLRAPARTVAAATELDGEGRRHAREIRQRQERALPLEHDARAAVGPLFQDDASEAVGCACSA